MAKIVLGLIIAKRKKILPNAATKGGAVTRVRREQI
jgi:hypothetical protein